MSVLAELVKLRSAGELNIRAAVSTTKVEETAIDPVCNMTVVANEKSRPFMHDGQTYYFCCPGCKATFEKDPAKYISQEASC